MNILLILQACQCPSSKDLGCMHHSRSGQTVIPPARQSIMNMLCMPVLYASQDTAAGRL